MEVGAPLPRAVASSRAVSAVRRLATARLAVAAVVTLSTAIHAALAWRRATPGYFPDEYMYAELGRSLLEHGTPLVRGESAQFLPLLYSLLTAPAWLWQDVELAYRTIQAFNSVAMSLAAIPVFLLARRLHVGDRLAVTAAALAVVLPELLYSSSVLAESLAYPLALAAVSTAVAAVERPLLRLQLAFLAFAGLAALSRLQLAVLPLCYVAAIAAVGLRERGLRATLREQWLAVGATVAFSAGGLGLALGGTLGLYGSLTAYSVEPVGAAKAIGVNALVLAYAAGWAIVPGALLGLALSLARPRGTGELAFGAFSLALVASLLLQAAVVGDVGRVQERYAIYAVPLLICLFTLYADRDWPHLRLNLLLGAVLAAAAAAVPLAGYAAADGSDQSLVLSALRRAELVVQDVGLASLLLALGATAFTAAALFLAWRRPVYATRFTIVATVGASVLISAGAHSWYMLKRDGLRAAVLPAERSWVDKADVGDVTLLLNPRAIRGDIHSTLFWNRSVARVILSRAATAPDAFAAPRAAIDGAGRLSVGGSVVTGPVLVDDFGASLTLNDARVVAKGPTKTLWLPRARAQIRLAMYGRYFSGLLGASGGRLTIWPDEPNARLAGWFELELRIPRDAAPNRFALRSAAGATEVSTVRPGRWQRLRVPVCAAGVWTRTFSTDTVAFMNGARVGVESTAPRFTVDATACSGRRHASPARAST